MRGIPRGADIPWSPWATTECDGTFRLTLFAPGGYTFLLGWRGVALETDDPRDPAQTLIDVANETKAELIVVGAHGNTGLKRFALGGVASKLSHHAPTSLLIVRDD